MRFEGQGGAAGFANGTARVALAPAEGGTRIDYAVNAQVGGKLAQIGSRLIDGAAAKLAGDFFARFVERRAVARVWRRRRRAHPRRTSPRALRAMRIRLLLAALILGGIAIYWWLHSA